MDPVSVSGSDLPARVLSVEICQPQPSWLAGFSLDAPAPGVQPLRRALDVRGWIVANGPVVKAIELTHGMRPICAIAVGDERPDIAAAFPDIPASHRSGFSGMASLLGGPLSFEIEVYAVTGDDARTRVMLAVIRGEREPLAAAEASRLQPIVVNSMGRMGTTWMMRLLRDHSGIVVPAGNPEVCAAQYYLHRLRVLAAPADGSPQAAGRDGFAGTLVTITPNPMYGPLTHDETDLRAWLDGPQVDALAESCVEAIDGFYRSVAGAQDDTMYFAEKSVPYFTPELAYELYPKMREVFLVRDVRDTFCSILAFNARRGYAAFGREQAVSEADFMERLARAYRRLATQWRRRSDVAHLVRYEDLAADPEAAVGDLLAFLDLPRDSAVVRRMIVTAAEDDDEVRDHRTSADLAASVGRWRDEIPLELWSKAAEVFDASLAVFGYSPTRTG